VTAVANRDGCSFRDKGIRSSWLVKSGSYMQSGVGNTAVYIFLHDENRPLCPCIDESIPTAMETGVYDDILRYKTSQTYPADASKACKRRLREKSESFLVKETTLFHKGQKGKEQRVVQRHEVADLLQQMHASVVGGCHFGMNATQKKLSERYWWPTMSEDVRHLVRTCER